MCDEPNAMIAGASGEYHGGQATLLLGVWLLNWEIYADEKGLSL